MNAFAGWLSPWFTKVGSPPVEHVSCSAGRNVNPGYCGQSASSTAQSACFMGRRHIFHASFLVHGHGRKSCPRAPAQDWAEPTNGWAAQSMPLQIQLLWTPPAICNCLWLHAATCSCSSVILPGSASTHLVLLATLNTRQSKCLAVRCQWPPPRPPNHTRLPCCCRLLKRLRRAVTHCSLACLTHT